MKDIKILLVGCGKMGSALLGGIINAGVLARNIVVIEPNIDAVPEDLNLRILKDFDQETIDYIEPNIIIFAVKPQIIESILPVYKQFSEQALFISIIAGKTVAFFESHLGANTAIVRSMPNLPALINQGVTVLYHKEGKVSEHQQNTVVTIFESVGDVHIIEDESMLDAVTAISGSGPAYLFHFIECLIQAGVDLGLPEVLAKNLTLKTIEGSAGLASSSQDSVLQLRNSVTSPKGTTQAALKIMMDEDNLKQLIIESTKAAYLRSKELSN